MNRVAAAFLALALLAGCGSGGEQKSPQPNGTRSATDVLRDGVIAAAVKAKLSAEDPDSATTLGVGVRGGVVTLRGSVRDAAARAKVVTGAKSVAGVVDVLDELRVDPHGPRPGQQLGDAALATRIAAAYTVQVGLQHVGVHVNQGVATLDGTVADPKTKATIVSTAWGTVGIRNVVDHIRVERP